MFPWTFCAKKHTYERLQSSVAKNGVKVQKSTILKTLKTLKEKYHREQHFKKQKFVKGLNTFARHCILYTLKMLEWDYIDVSH